MLFLFPAVFANPNEAVLKLNALGKVISSMPSIQKEKDLRFVVQFSSPEESADAQYILRYSCFNKNDKEIFSEDKAFPLAEKERFRSNINLSLDKKCVKGADRIYWDLFLTRAHIWKVQKILHSFLLASSELDAYLQGVISKSDKNWIDVRLMNTEKKKVLEIINRLENTRSSLKGVSPEYKKAIQNSMHIDIDNLKTFSNVLKEDVSVLSIMNHNRSNFLSFWQNVQGTSGEESLMPTKEGQEILHDIASLKSQMAEANEEDIEELREELKRLQEQKKVLLESKKDQSVSSLVEISKDDIRLLPWPLIWLSSGVLFQNQKNGVYPINVEMPVFQDQNIVANKPISLLLYNTQNDWQIGDIIQEKIQKENEGLPSLPVDLLLSLPSNQTLNLMLQTATNLLTHTTLRDINSKYPPPPSFQLQTEFPLYRTQEISLGTFSDNDLVGITLVNTENESRTIKQNLTIAKMRQIGVRSGFVYVQQQKEIEDIQYNSNGEIVWEQDKPRVSYSPSGYELGLLYGVAIYSRPTWVDELTPQYKQPLHLFLGTSYTGGGWQSLLMLEEVINSYVGLGFDITQGVGFSGGVHFGKTSFLDYDNTTYRWDVKEGYGMKGFFIGFTGDLRLDKIFKGNLFPQNRDE